MTELIVTDRALRRGAVFLCILTGLLVVAGVLLMGGEARDRNLKRAPVINVDKAWQHSILESMPEGTPIAFDPLHLPPPPPEYKGFEKFSFDLQNRIGVYNLYLLTYGVVIFNAVILLRWSWKKYQTMTIRSETG